jgi:2-oxoglutarate ferredoxin oxidoreductase subunit gamma
MIMLGAYLGHTKCVDIETVLDALLEKLGERKAKLIPLNREALLRGADCVK